MSDSYIAVGVSVFLGIMIWEVIKWWFDGKLDTITCMIFHNDCEIVKFYSNRSHRYKCNKCNREWED